MSDAIERVRRACLSLPEATEQEAWGEATWRVRKKVFAMFASAANHHGAGDDSVWCAAPLGVQEILVHQDPEKFFVPPYVGTRGWFGIRVNAVDDDELRSLLVQSYCTIAPKKLQALVAD